VADVLTRPSTAVEDDVQTPQVEAQASSVASDVSAGVPASDLFDPTRGRDSNAAYLYDPTRGHESRAAYLYDPTRGRDADAAYLYDPTRGRDSDAFVLQRELKRWGRTKGLSAASA